VPRSMNNGRHKGTESYYPVELRIDSTNQGSGNRRKLEGECKPCKGKTKHRVIVELRGGQKGNSIRRNETSGYVGALLKTIHKGIRSIIDGQ